MRRVWKTLLLAAVTVSALMSYAFADVAGGPVVWVGVPVFVIAVIIIALVMVVRAVLQSARQKKSRDLEDMTCRHDDAEDRARHGYWDNRDPWDETKK